jgi:hypothetical protein
MREIQKIADFNSQLPRFMFERTNCILTPKYDQFISAGKKKVKKDAKDGKERTVDPQEESKVLPSFLWNQPFSLE